jgi:hypothetical protein
VLALGVLCVALGVVLVAEPFRSTATLAWLVGAALIATGVSRLGTADGTASQWWGVRWGRHGSSPAWSRSRGRDISVRALAVLVGIALVVGGLVELALVLWGDDEERSVRGLGGLTNVVAGGLALAWRRSPCSSSPSRSASERSCTASSRSTSRCGCGARRPMPTTHAGVGRCGCG